MKVPSVPSIEDNELSNQPDHLTQPRSMERVADNGASFRYRGSQLDPTFQFDCLADGYALAWALWLAVFANVIERIRG